MFACMRHQHVLAQTLGRKTSFDVFSSNSDVHIFTPRQQEAILSSNANLTAIDEPQERSIFVAIIDQSLGSCRPPNTADHSRLAISLSNTQQYSTIVSYSTTYAQPQQNN